MKINLSDIVVRTDLTVRIDVDEPRLPECDWEFVQPVRGELRLTNSGGLMSLAGDFETTLEHPCRRCLASVRLEAPFTVEEHFLLERMEDPTVSPEGGEELDEVLPTVIQIEGGVPVLDVTELLRQSIILQTPAAWLCQPDCRGLCPRCGANLNEAECECAEAVPAGPLAALGALLEEKDV